MKSNLLIPALLVAALLGGAASCKKKTAPVTTDPGSTEKTLLENYRNGEISKCSWKEQTVFVCQRNAPDAGSEVFDASGSRIGGCYYNTGMVDAVCEETSGCTVIYRVDKNIWGKPGINEIEK